MNSNFEIINNFFNELKKNKCIVNGKIYDLKYIEELGYEKFIMNFRWLPEFKLYKYFPNIYTVTKEGKEINYSIEALKNNEVYLNNATNFDDCFDCVIDINYEKFCNIRLNKYCEYFNLSTKMHENDNKFLKEKISSYLTEMLFSRKENDIYNEITDDLKKLKVRWFVKKFLEKYLPTKDSIISIDSILADEHSEFTEKLSEFRITCFSTSPYLNRMWSEYANKNKGFCVEYDIDLNNTGISKDIYYNLFPVIYAQKRSDASFLSTMIDDHASEKELWQLCFNGFLRKSFYWVDQCEWRLALHKSMIESNSLKFYKISRVYFGSKMDKEDEENIKKICKEKNIDTIKIMMEENSFNLIDCK